MSLLGDLFSSLTENSSSDFTPPCALCPGDCAIAPGACAQCQPYKEQLTDALYNVDHLEEFLDRYEVTGSASSSSGNTTCPYCGAPSASPFTCEYCGMQIKEDNGKIRVASANDIPDPILEARDIIYERHSNVVSKYTQGSSGGLLSSLLGLLDSDNTSDLGSRMSKDEIIEAADAYGVSVSTYLNGLDNGKYLSLAQKKEADSASLHTNSVSGLGLAGSVVAGGLGLGSMAAHVAPPQPPHNAKPPVRPPQQQPRPAASQAHQAARRPQAQHGVTANGARPQNLGQNHHQGQANHGQEQSKRPQSQARPDGNHNPGGRGKR